MADETETLAGAIAPADAKGSGTAAPVESSTTATNTQGGDYDKMLMDKVNDLLKKPAEGGEPSAPETEAGANDSGEEEPTDVPAPTVDKDAVKANVDNDVPFHTHPRWKQVLKERDEARTASDTTKAELDALRPQAEGFVRLQEYCQQNGIADNEVQEALDLLALSKTNTAEFRRRLQTYADVIDFSQGTRLPQDLEEKVAAGVITAEDAAELSRYRVQKNHLDKSMQASAGEKQQRLVADITSSINAWQQDNAKRDPGFNDPDRLAMLTDRIHALWNAKQPTDVRSAIAIAEQANTDVKARLAKMRPVPPVRKPLPTNGSSVKPKAAGPIQSMDELEKVMFDYGTKRLAARKA